MSLIITENNGTFFLNGNINSGTSGSLQNHLETLIDLENEITINIESVSEIDANGVFVLKNIHNNAVKHNKTLSIVGNGCKDLYAAFGAHKSA